jgi:branched-chain amino acid transport system permease protein
MFFVLFFPQGIWGTILSKLNLNQGSKSWVI